MANTLLVPIRVRQLYVAETTQVASASADFSRLPYYDASSKMIVNNDSPFISENVVNEPFEDNMNPLGKGNHLHFILPSQFTHFNSDDANLPAPNRWLITKNGDSGSQQWIIESDFLSKTQVAGQAGVTTIIPVPEANETGFEVYAETGQEFDQAFRYLGRQLSLEDWQQEGSTGSTPIYWKEIYQTYLTAFAYGDAQFPVLYPNCRSVFGFHDEAGLEAEAADYQILGWFHYTKAENETLIQQIIADVYTAIDDVLADQSLIDSNNQEITNKNQIDAFFQSTQTYNWQFDPNNFQIQTESGETGDISTLTDIKTYFDSIEEIVFYSETIEIQDAMPESPNVTLAVGNNGVEALSAYVAATTYPGTDSASEQNRQQLEDKLEAIQFDYLKSMQLDLGAKFEEARHAKGFKAIPSGIIWDYSYRDANGGTSLTPNQLNEIAQFEATGHMAQLANLLNVLNRVQSQYQTNSNSIDSQQNQLFAYWYKYMLSAHPPIQQQSTYPHPDQVLAFLSNQVIPQLDELMNGTGLVETTYSASQSVVQKAIPITTEITIQASGTGEGNLIVQNISDSGSPIMANQPILLPTDDAYKLISPTDFLNGTILDGQDTEGQIAWAKCVFDQLWRVTQEAINANEALRDFETGTGVDANSGLEIRIVNKPAPRYYRPSEPTILIAENVVPTAVNDEAAILTSGLQPIHQPTLDQAMETYQSSGNLQSLETTVAAYSVQIGIDTDYAKTLAWHPILMEWEVAFYPLDDPNTNTVGYQKDFVQNLFDLPPDQPEFVPITGTGAPQSSSGISTYRGYAHLTPYALKYLNQKLEPYGPGGADSGQDVQLTQAYEQMNNSGQEMAVLSQSLSGFNDAFIMHKQSLQLAAIADPVAMDAYKPYIQQIQTYIGKNIGRAPLPSNDFNPIRGGGLNITHLNLIDTFGQKTPIYNYFTDGGKTKVEVPSTMSLPADSNISWEGYSGTIQAFLYPRFIQASRLHARWLSKDSDEIECGAHYLDSPICGWIVHNILDDSLMIYDYEGNLLGSIGIVSGKVAALPKPESTTFDPESDITNTHLQNLVKYLLAHDQDFFQNFLRLLTNAQEYTDPETYAQHPELALLMGQPLALMRMRLNFELQGDYAINESWQAFEQQLLTLNGVSAPTDGFEGVEVPTRLGDYQQLNDGLIGFWDDGTDASLDVGSTFYSPMGNLYETESYKDKYNDDNNTTQFQQFVQNDVYTEITQSLVDDPRYFTIIFDPRGKLNITAGVLPVKTIDIPSALYQSSLQNIRVTFLMSPILTPKDDLQFPVPKEAGYQWKWISKYIPGNPTSPTTSMPVARTVPAAPTIAKGILNQQWDSLNTVVDDIYDKLLNTVATGYQAVLTEYTSATDTSTGTSTDIAYIQFDQIKASNLAKPIFDNASNADTLTQQLMQIMLDHHQGITSVVTGAQLQPNEVREGWLELIEQPQPQS